MTIFETTQQEINVISIGLRFRNWGFVLIEGWKQNRLRSPFFESYFASKNLCLLSLLVFFFLSFVLFHLILHIEYVSNIVSNKQQTTTAASIGLVPSVRIGSQQQQQQQQQQIKK